MLRQALASVHLIAGIVLLGVGGVFFAIAATAFLNEPPYRSSLEADALVIRKTMLPATQSASTSYQRTYALRPSEREQRQKTEEVDAATRDSVEEKSTVRVQYLPGDSQSARIHRRAWDVPWGIAAAFCLAVALFGLGLVLRGVGDVRQTRRIYREGEPAEATVIAVHETNVSINRQTAITWARSSQGTSVPISPVAAFEWEAGDKGIVRYDRERPQHSVWIGSEQLKTTGS